jgi:hypothetical protein
MKDIPGRTARFTPGFAYFILLYQDAALTVPVVQTLIFCEDRSRGDGHIEHVFREIKTRGEEAPFVVHENHAEDLVLDLRGLVQRLGSDSAT